MNRRVWIDRCIFELSLAEFYKKEVNKSRPVQRVVDYLWIYKAYSVDIRNGFAAIDNFKHWIKTGK